MKTISETPSIREFHSGHVVVRELNEGAHLVHFPFAPEIEALILEPTDRLSDGAIIRHLASPRPVADIRNRNVIKGLGKWLTGSEGWVVSTQHALAGLAATSRPTLNRTVQAMIREGEIEVKRARFRLR